MSMEYISLISQSATGLATLAVAVFLASQLRLQHKDSVTGLGVGMTQALAELTEVMIKDSEFADIFLRGIEGDPNLSKLETHRFNLYLINYFAQAQEIWSYNSQSDKAKTYASTMINAGPGVLNWLDSIGKVVLQPGFFEFVRGFAKPQN